MRLIDADALKAKYEQMIPEIGDGYHKETLQDVLFELEYAPTIYLDELRGVGKWTKRFDGPYGRGRTYCSSCGKHSGIGGIKQTPPYCPNCGAKMEVSEDA